MSLKHRKEQIDFRNEIEHNSAGQRIVNSATEILALAKQSGARKFDANTTFYPDHDARREASGHEYYCTLDVEGVPVTIRDLIYEESGPKESVGACYMVYGDTLLRERSSEGYEGEFGMIFYTNDLDHTIEGVEARCFRNGETVEAPLEIIQDVAGALEHKLQSGDIEFHS